MEAPNKALVVVIDIETNGCRNGATIDSPYHKIVQLSAIPLCMDMPFDTLVNPGVHIPAASTAIHGISNEDVANAPSFTVAWKNFRDYLANICNVMSKTDGLPGEEDSPVSIDDLLLCAHNMFGFDARVLSNETGGFSDTPNAMIDSLIMFREAYPLLSGRSPYSLPILYNTLTQKVFHTAHNALEDVKALKELLINCKELNWDLSLVQYHPKEEGVNLIDLYAQYLPDLSSLVDLKYVGVRRGRAIADFLRRNDWEANDCKTVGGLRKYFNLHTVLKPEHDKQWVNSLETMLRLDANIFSDADMNSIMTQLTGTKWAVHIDASFAYYNFRTMKLTNNEAKALWGHNIRSICMIRELYMYKYNEDPFAFVSEMHKNVPEVSVATLQRMLREIQR